jgi:hypothetical protein
MNSKRPKAPDCHGNIANFQSLLPGGVGGASRKSTMLNRRLADAFGSSGSSGSEPALPEIS